MSERLDEIIKSRDHEAFEKEFGNVQDFGFGIAPKKNEGDIAYSCGEPLLAINPNGFYVLIEMEEVKDVSKGGIILGDVRKEQDACDIGYIRAVGNTAFIGMPGCNPSEYNPTEPQFKMTPAQIWGIDIGDKVEYRRHEGKISGIPGNERMRYIPDTQIIGKVL